MYQCKGCGGELAFNAHSGLLQCKYCNQEYNPYDITKESDGYQSDFFEATFFTCPQCGGQIYTTDTQTAGFCSYCGSSTVLSSRLDKGQKPDAIIPFKMTKEDCKDAYKKVMRKAIFAPKELKDPKYIEEFRGIYMPYWKYLTYMDDSFNIKASKQYRQGDYIYTKHYQVTGEAEAWYKGFTYDSSTAFYDNISEPLAPFDITEEKKFTPSFLSGFYAEMEDVPVDLYLDDAITSTTDDIIDNIAMQPEVKPYKIDKEKERRTLLPKCDVAERMLFPVWFLSYRKDDRVAYATINGQTGKMVADIPVDVKKYLFGSLLLAIPIFLFMNILPLIMPATLLTISGIFALISLVVYNVEVKKIKVKENNLDDKALNWKHGRPQIDKKEKNEKIASFVMALVIGVVFFIFIGMNVLPILLAVLTFTPRLAGMAIGVLNVILALFGIIAHHKEEATVGGLGYYLTILASTIMAVVSLISPVSDIPYYVSVLILLVSMVFVYLDIIRNYNRLVTRRMPQFEMQGGDDRA